MYFDRNFGKRFPEAVRRARPPFTVEYQHDPNNRFKFADTTTDDEWIARVAAEGWVILSHDRKFHVRLPEIAAIKQHNAGCFYLPGANWQTWDKARHFMRFYDGIANRIEVTVKPYIYNLAATGKFTQISIP